MEHNCHAKQQHQMQSDSETISQTIKSRKQDFANYLIYGMLLLLHKFFW